MFGSLEFGSSGAPRRPGFGWSCALGLLLVWGLAPGPATAAGAGGDKAAEQEKHTEHGEDEHGEGEHGESGKDGHDQDGHGKDGHGKDGHGKDGHDQDGHSKDGHGDGKGHGKGGHGHSSRLTDEVIPLAIDTMPERPKPLVELGEPFLGTGTLDPGFELPTGAVWQPSLLVFGTLRTALQSFEPDTGPSGRITELTTRLDLFANLQLSGSERLVVGVRALDGNNGFTSYFVEHPDPSVDGEFFDEIDADIEVLFFEGDFGEIFPNISRDDFGATDIGFSVGRQDLLFQEGMLINDVIDGIGLTRNTLLPGNSSNFRATLFYGWGDIDTSLNAERDAELLALLTSTDLPATTMDADIAYLMSDDPAVSDLVAAGVSFVQRIGRTNSSFRLLGSMATDDETPFATDGLLLFNELSWVPHGTHDLVYFNSFWAMDEYTPIARGVGGVAAGPLGRAGINFAPVGLGSFDAALSSAARDVAGGAVGYQRFFDQTRKQVLAELGFRFGTDNSVPDSYAATVRYQAAIGRRLVAVVDGFYGYREIFGGGSETPYGGRLELVVKF